MGNITSMLSQSAKKRARDEESLEVIYQKKPKIDSSQLRLVDINADCLQVIFECLSLEDLFNVAETHPQFAPVARTVYSRRYRKKLVFLSLDIQFIGDECIEIRKDVAAAFFCYFGPAILSLCIKFMGHRDVEIEKSLLEHCTASLVDLQLEFCNTSNLDTINEPFGKVEKLTITNGSLNQKLSQLNIWFPSVTHLLLFNVESSQPELLAANLPQLKRLVIHNEKMTISLATVSGMLRANPQIESLVLYCDYDVDFLQLISKHLPQLKELELWSTDDRFFSFGDVKIHLENVEKFTLIAPYPRGEFVLNMPFVFKNLQELSLDGFNEYKNQLLNFIKENPGIKRLDLIPCLDDWDDLTYIDLVSMVNSLPNLVELTFCADTFMMNDIIQFLMKNKHLEMVRAVFVDLPVWPEFAAAVDAKWTFDAYYSGDSMDCYFFKLIRKN